MTAAPAPHSADPEHENIFARAPVAVLARRLASEAFGTFFLVFVDVGGAALGAVSEHEVTAAARAAATGLVIMCLIYSIGNVSGAHFNPAVTLAFFLRGVFPARLLVPYWCAQLVGGCVASLVLSAQYGDALAAGMTLTHLSERTAFIMETLLTCLLVSVILGTATQHRVVGANAAIASGGTVALCALFARPASGASMNPTRSLAPALVCGRFDGLWVYLSAPFLGSLIAMLVMRFLHPKRHREEVEAARGKG